MIFFVSSSYIYEKLKILLGIYLNLNEWKPVQTFFSFSLFFWWFWNNKTKNIKSFYSYIYIVILRRNETLYMLFCCYCFLKIWSLSSLIKKSLIYIQIYKSFSFILYFCFSFLFVVVVVWLRYSTAGRKWELQFNTHTTQSTNEWTRLRTNVYKKNFNNINIIYVWFTFL